MTTNYQTARTALGARLRELRTEAGLTARQVAAELGWVPSKVSKLENGRQTPTVSDLNGWAAAVGQARVGDELVARLRALESHYASWRRQLAAGTRASQQSWAADEQKSRTVRNFEAACIPGLLQTPEYARHMFTRTTDLQRTPPDIEGGVRARIHRQQLLYEPDREFRFILWEAALRVLFCPPHVMAGQLDRLAGLIGMDTLSVGIVPLGSSLSVVPSHAFWIFDERLVRIETISAELRITDAVEVATYLEVWRQLERVAVYGPEAHRLIGRAHHASGTGDGG